MLIPILPAMKSSLDLSQMQVSLVITVFSIAAAIFIPIVGYLSDRYTRKVVIVPSLFLFALGGLLAGISAAFFSNIYIWILIGRIFQGIGAAGAAPIAMALTGDLFKGAEQSRVLGIFEASNGLGKVLSPILGSLAGLVTWYTVFFTFPGLCILAIIFVLFFVKEKPKLASPPPFRKYLIGLKSVFKMAGRWLSIAYLAGGICLFTLFGILFYLSDMLEEEYKIEGVIKGFILSIPLLVMVSFAYITGNIIGKKFNKMKRLIIIGFSCMTLSYALLIITKQLVLFLIVLSISSIGAGLVLPCVNSLITGSVGKDRRGFVSSLYGSVRFIGVAAGPPIFARLMDWSRSGMFISIAILTCIVGLLVLIFIHVRGNDDKKKRKHQYQYNYI